MNRFVVDPEWGWWIVGYFYLGGIAAGAYFSASLIDFFVGARARHLTRTGYVIAVPLIVVCGLFLTIDLEQPPRFWHMLFKSEVVKDAIFGGHWANLSGAIELKRWTPMSIGSWALTLFGLCSTLSLVGSLWAEGKYTRWLHFKWIERILQVVGSLAGFFVAGYTGTLLSATNQPLWSDSVWIASLFLVSAASTGLATMLVFGSVTDKNSAELYERLEKADLLVLCIELVVFTAFARSLFTWWQPILATTQGKQLLIFTPIVAIILPLGMYLLRRFKRLESLERGALFCVLFGGFILRASIAYTPGELLANPAALEASNGEQTVGTPPAPWPGGWLTVSPEDGRQAGRGPGADPQNRPVHVRSKILSAETPAP